MAILQEYHVGTLYENPRNRKNRHALVWQKADMSCSSLPQIANSTLNNSTDNVAVDDISLIMRKKKIEVTFESIVLL